MLPRLGLQEPGAASISTTLGATRDFHHGLAATLRLKPTSARPQCGGSASLPDLFHSPVTRGLDIPGGDDKIDLNVTIWPIGDV